MRMKQADWHECVGCEEINEGKILCGKSCQPVATVFSGIGYIIFLEDY